jgi:hypothetical protein
MKKYLLIIVTLLSAVSSYGQAVVDKAAVLQKILDLPEMLEYYPKNNDGSMKQLCIMQYPTTFTSDVTSALDVSKMEFRSSEAIKASMIPAYFAFRVFEVETNTATATVNYFYNYNWENGEFKVLTINIDLQKSGSEWSVLAHVIGGDK